MAATTPEARRRALLESMARQRPGQRTALDWLQGALWRIPGRPMRVSRLLQLRYDGVPRPSPRLLRGTAVVRAGAPADIEGMSRCEGKPAAEFAQRFAAGDACVVAEANGAIIGYEWFSTASHHDEAHFGFRIEIEDGAVYAYDGYVVPEHRLTGTWMRFQQYIGTWIEQNNRTSVITLIEISNRASLTAHLRLGFSPYCEVTVVSLLGYRWIHRKPL